MDSEKIEQEAGNWFARRDSSSWSESDEAQFNEWLQRHTAHRIAYLRLEAAWDHAARLQALGAGVPGGLIPPRGSWGNGNAFERSPPETHPPPVVRESRWKKAIPALAAAVALFAVTLYIVATNSFAGTLYETRVGATETVTLADGSRITLNTDTRVHVMFTGRERRVRLERGEAYFEVAKDAKRRFVVDAEESRVAAVGTRFAVRLSQQSVQVVVTEGRVKLATADDEIIQAALDAGSVARVSGRRVVQSVGSAAIGERLLSWRRGYVVFDDTALAEAVTELNRYNTRKIVIEDSSIAGFRVGGNFRCNNTEAFLSLLQRAFPIQVDRTAERVILRYRPIVGAGSSL